MKRLILGFLTLLTAGQMALVAMPVGAQTQPDADPLKGLKETQLGGDPAQAGTQLPLLIGRIIRTILGLLGIIFLVLMVYAGFLWMTARGDSKKVDQAKQLITGAIIGVVIIAGAYTMTDFVIKAITGQATTGTGTGNETPSTIGTKQLGEPCTSGSDCAPPNSCDIGGTNKCF